MRILQAELDEANTAYKEIKAKLDNANEPEGKKPHCEPAPNLEEPS